MKVVLTNTQKEALTKLWFIYGNGGKKATLGNHKFIQCLLELNEDYRKSYVRTPFVIHALTSECIVEVDKILDALKIGDKVSFNTNAIHQETQRSLNRLRGKIIAIEQNSYIVKTDKFMDRLPFAATELTKL
jgi:hypothetical protein